MKVITSRFLKMAVLLPGPLSQPFKLHAKCYSMGNIESWKCIELRKEVNYSWLPFYQFALFVIFCRTYYRRHYSGNHTNDFYHTDGVNHTNSVNHTSDINNNGFCLCVHSIPVCCYEPRHQQQKWTSTNKSDKSRLQAIMHIKLLTFFSHNVYYAVQSLLIF